MILFADTSALAKRYIEESGSDVVDELLSRADILIVSSDKKLYDIALVEFNGECVLI